jgi:hypothetical protein
VKPSWWIERRRWSGLCVDQCGFERVGADEAWTGIAKRESMDLNSR